MDIKEVKKFLEEDSEGKKLLKGLVEDHEAVEGLKTKRDELIASNKKLKKERDDAVSKNSELEEENEELKSGDGKVDVDAAIAKATKKIQKELDDANKKVTDSDNRIHKLLVDNGLAEAIAKANIAKQHIPAVKALLRAENKIDVDETDNVAKVGDKDLATFVTDWAQGDIGKNYVAASNNSGGGANGSGGGKSSNEDLMKLSPKERLIKGRQQAAANG